jgi:hypothetical protein
VNCIAPKRTNQASALENVAQQIPGAFGIAILASLLTSQQSQLIADRAAMLGPDSPLSRAAGSAIAGLKVMTADTPDTFALFYRAATHLLVDVMSHALSNMFLLLAVTSAIGVVLGLLLPLHQAPVEDEPDAVQEPAGVPPAETDGDPREPATAVGHGPADQAATSSQHIGHT